VGIKSSNPPCPVFAGIFPGVRSDPVVLIRSSWGGRACALLSDRNINWRLHFLGFVDRIRFIRPARTGATIIINSEIVKIKGQIGKGRGPHNSQWRNGCVTRRDTVCQCDKLRKHSLFKFFY
jgi:3-hydroxyacyl-[acyl-carrier-protein] dehydratase